MSELEPLDSETRGGRGRPRPLPEKMEQALRLASNELLRRLASPKQAAEISDSNLIKLFVELNKLELRDQEKQLSAQTPRTVQVLQILQQDGLPAARRQEVLLSAIDQARRQGDPVSDLVQALEALVGKHKADDLLEALNGSPLEP